MNTEIKPQRHKGTEGEGKCGNGELIYRKERREHKKRDLNQFVCIADAGSGDPAYRVDDLRDVGTTAVRDHRAFRAR